MSNLHLHDRVYENARRNGKETVLVYDKLNRVRKVKVDGELTQEYTYDKNNNMRKVVYHTSFWDVRRS
ncbi:MAG: hypothetical protein OIF32_10450 [Campylobacterales bacterium]|nr:hypothetical protein [Campylobacterales bacterium]